MANRVIEVMNSEVLTFTPDTRADAALRDILAFGITAAPVTDSEGRPIGVTSLRDLVNVEGHRPVAEVMSRPVVAIETDVSLQDASEQLASANLRHLVVVDRDHKVRGMISALDLLRGILGLPTPHPNAFPHYDPELDTTWTDDRPLHKEHMAEAPEKPGIVVLVRSRPGLTDTVVWVEAPRNVKQRLNEMLTTRQHTQPILARVLEGPSLRFRYAIVGEMDRRRDALARVVERTRNGWLPGWMECA